jgi:hypothetical protein
MAHALQRFLHAVSRHPTLVNSEFVKGARQFFPYTFTRLLIHVVFFEEKDSTAFQAQVKVLKYWKKDKYVDILTEASNERIGSYTPKDQKYAFGKN